MFNFITGIGRSMPEHLRYIFVCDTATWSCPNRAYVVPKATHVFCASPLVGYYGMRIRNTINFDNNRQATLSDFYFLGIN